MKKRPPGGWLPTLAAGLVCAVALAGCRNIPPAPPWDAGTSDANVIVYVDSDGDGLCDDTEYARGTDPTIPDTDGDGVSDRVEVDFGFQPTRTDSPDRELLYYVSEAAGASIDVPITYTTSGQGQSFTGAFQSLVVADPFGASIDDYYAGSIALGARPMENVFEVRPEDQRIDGVVGRTELVYSVSFESPPVEARGCMRAYPWRYNIKRNDGRLVFARRYLLVVVPDGASTWCAPTSCI